MKRKNHSMTVFIPITIVVPLLLAGCDSRESWQVKTYPTSGTVMVNGSAPLGAVIFLEPTKGDFDKRQSRPWGAVTSSGSFQLMTYKAGDGAPEGEFKLLMSWPTPGLEGYDRLGGKFISPANPVSIVTVKPGKNQLPPVELKDVKVVTR